jgi:hypothetical protein
VGSRPLWMGPPMDDRIGLPQAGKMVRYATPRVADLRCRMKVRLLVDSTGESVLYDSDREPTAIVRDSVQVMREANHQQSVFRLCLHISDDTLTLHWYADDDKFAAAILDTAAIVTRGTTAILTGEVPA